MENKNSKLQKFFLIGFFLILALPLLNLPPWFSPPDWGKTIVFKIILAILIFVFSWQVLSKKQIAIKTSLPFWLLVSLFGIFFLATIFSLDPCFSLWGSPYRSGGFLNFAFYIVFAILAFLILKKSDWQKIWNFAFIIGILVSIIAIFQQLGLISKIFIPFEARPPSTIGGPIFLAIYLLLLSFLALSFGLQPTHHPPTESGPLREKNFIKKPFYFLSFLLFFFVAIFITQTRAVIIGYMIGFLFFIFFYPIRKPSASNGASPTKKFSISLILKLLALIVLLSGIYGIYFVNTQTELPQFIQKDKFLLGVTNRLSVKVALEDPRISGWKVSWEALKERPILGYGPDNFSIGFDRYYDAALPAIEPGGVTSWWDRAHNFVFDIGVTAGIPALMIYLSLFGVLFFQMQKLKYYPNLRMKSESTNDSVIAHGIQATFLAYLVANFFSFDTFSTYLISFLLIGYSLHLTAENNADSNAEGPLNSASIQRINQRKFSGETFFVRIFTVITKWKVLIFIMFGILLIWFIWVFNVKPFQINKEIKVARSQSKNGDYAGAIKRMENLLNSHTFLDNYLRLNYIDIINECLEKSTEQTQIFLVQKARQILKENIKIQPYYTRNWLLLGNYTNVLIEKGERDLKDEANYYFERANQLSPKRQEVLIGWLKTDFLTGDYLEAKEKAQKCIDLNPNLGECWWLTALINISLTEDKKAQENINIAGQKGYPIYSESSFLQLANVYSKTKNYQRLVEIYQELINIRPTEPRYHSFLATVYKELGQFEKARQEALIVLELAPEFKEEIEEFLRELP